MILTIDWVDLANCEREAMGLTAITERVQADYERLQADNAELRALLLEAAPKCDECGQIATLFYNDSDYDYFYCDAHKDSKDDVFFDYGLGRKIKAALEE